MPEDRRLAAIMFTDIVGYTELMGRDEDQAFQLLRKNRDIQRPLIKKYRGEWLKEMGDGILASFSSASDAVRCASEIQTACKKGNIALRIGIHEGEVVFENSDVLGDGVNVASRLEELAEEGSINISGAVYKDIKNKAGIVTEFIEEKELKGVDEPVKMYRILGEGEELQPKPTVEKPKKSRKKYLYYLLGCVVIVIVALLVWNYLPEKSTVQLEKSIAVLPLDYLSEDPNKQYLADGVMDAITGHLSKIEGLRVTPRTSVMQYRGTTKTASNIGEELDVSYLIEGSFLMKDDQVRLTIQLVNAEEEDYVWFETYKRNWEDIFAVESEVAQTIAKEVEVAITPDVKERIELMLTDNIEAYDLFIEGNENYYSSWDSMNINRVYKSIELYKKAIKLDKNFSFALTGLGRSYRMLAELDTDSTESKLWEQSYEYLTRAIEIDVNNGWAYAEMAVALSNYFWDSTATRIYLDKAIQLMPNDPNAYIHYFFHEIRLGNCEKARWILESLKRFFKEMEHPFNQKNLMLLRCEGKYSEVVSIANEHWEMELEPQGARPIFYSAIAIDSLGMANRIVDYVREGIKDDHTTYILWKAILTAKEGNRQLAYQLIDSLELLPNPRPHYFACIYAALQEKDKMYEYLDRGLLIREGGLHNIAFVSTFDPYKNEPRFKEIKAKMWTPLELDD